MIAILDYGAGNLTSVAKALRYIGADVEVTFDPQVVADADSLVLPGVGHFSSTSAIADRNLTAPIQQAIAEGKPFLGICVGLQWMFAGSTEAPGVAALACFSGTCERFPVGARVPHVGWNQLNLQKSSRLLEGIAEGSYVYYTHSYFAPLTPDTVATTDYGCTFTAVAERDNVFAVQFHPEKSADTGLAILRNFVRLAC